MHVSRRELIAFLQSHHEELVILRDMFDDDPDHLEDRAAVELRIACVEQLLREKGIEPPPRALLH